jgi:DNA-binding NarL/FixJ family response regulator
VFEREEDALPASLRSAGPIDILAKSFDAAELLQAVRAALDIRPG